MPLQPDFREKSCKTNAHVISDAAFSGDKFRTLLKTRHLLAIMPKIFSEMDLTRLSVVRSLCW